LCQKESIYHSRGEIDETRFGGITSMEILVRAKVFHFKAVFKVGLSILRMKDFKHSMGNCYPWSELSGSALLPGVLKMPSSCLDLTPMQSSGEPGKCSGCGREQGVWGWMLEHTVNDLPSVTQMKEGMLEQEVLTLSSNQAGQRSRPVKSLAYTSPSQTLLLSSFGSCLPKCQHHSSYQILCIIQVSIVPPLL
jgi:hypothetical protein